MTAGTFLLQLESRKKLKTAPLATSAPSALLGAATPGGVALGGGLAMWR
jgi:hypothetical protein